MAFYEAPILMTLPKEIRLRILELACEDIMPHIVVEKFEHL